MEEMMKTKLVMLQTAIHDILISWPVKFDNAAWQLVKALLELRELMIPGFTSERSAMDRAMDHVREATSMVSARGYGNTWLAVELTGLAEALGYKQLEIRWPRMGLDPSSLSSVDTRTPEPENDEVE
jgi:hypothetical protein